MSAINLDKLSVCTKPTNESRDRKKFADDWLKDVLIKMGSNRRSEDYYICANDNFQAVCHYRGK